MVDAVIFDGAGTLTPWSSIDPRGASQAFAAAVHADDADRVDELAAALLGAENVRWAAVRDYHTAFTVPGTTSGWTATGCWTTSTPADAILQRLEDLPEILALW